MGHNVWEMEQNLRRPLPTTLDKHCSSSCVDTLVGDTEVLIPHLKPSIAASWESSQFFRMILRAISDTSTVVLSCIVQEQIKSAYETGVVSFGSNFVAGMLINTLKQK